MFTLFKKTGVILKLRKCKLFTETIDYLGYVIPPRRPKIASHTTDAVRELQTPINLTKLRSFLGLRNVFRRFVSKFARLAAPLNKNLRKDNLAAFAVLNDKETQPMNALNDALMLPPVLALPNSTGHITLDIDACASYDSKRTEQLNQLANFQSL